MNERTKLILADVSVMLGVAVIAIAFALRWATANGIVIWG